MSNNTKTIEELQLEIFELKEKEKSQQILLEERDTRIKSLEKTNTRLYDKVTSSYSKEEDVIIEEPVIESFDDFIKKQIK